MPQSSASILVSCLAVAKHLDFLEELQAVPNHLMQHRRESAARLFAVDDFDDNRKALSHRYGACCNRRQELCLGQTFTHVDFRISDAFFSSALALSFQFPCYSPC